jgi:hypothetical protein
MRKQAKAALLHLALSAALYALLYQWKVASAVSFLLASVFLSIIFPVGRIALPLGLSGICHAASPLGVAIMGLFFACNSYLWTFALCKVSSLLQQRHGGQSNDIP